MKHALAFLLGTMLGSAAMGAYGWWLELAPVAPHRTLPRPAWDAPVPVGGDPLDLIPATTLPIR